MTGISRFDCFPSDFLNGIIGLSPDEIAVYTVIMMLQYDRAKPVVYEGREREIAIRAGRMPSARLRKAVDHLIEIGKLKLVDGSLSNGRAEAELVKIDERIAKNRENSARGGESTRRKWGGKRNTNNERIEPTGRPIGVVPLGPIPRPPSPVQQEETTQPARGDRLSQVEADSLEGKLLQAVTEGGGRYSHAARPALLDLSPIRGLIDAGYDLETEILPVVRARSARVEVRSWAYFVEPVHESRVKRLSAATPRSAINGARAGPGSRSAATRPLPRDPVLQAREELLRERESADQEHL